MLELYVQYFTNNFTAAAIFVGTVSLLIGSFLNVVIHRVPIMMQKEWESQITDTEESEPYNLVSPRSSCPHCQSPVKSHHNIPLISYIFILRGKCANCSQKISLRYPIVEIATALISLIVLYTFGFNLVTVFALLFSWSLIALTFIDLDHYLLPDRLTLPLLWLGLLINTQHVFTDLMSAVIGAAAGYLTLWSIYWLFKLVTGKEGMGYGDFKLLAALCAWMGIESLPMIILLSSVSGVIIALVLALLKKHQLEKPLPFGPYLTIAGFVTLLWGDQIQRYYFSLIL